MMPRLFQKGNFRFMPLRLIFMGTPDFAVPTLLALHEAGHKILAVYTRMAKPAKRGMTVQPSPVEQEARRLGIPVVTPTTLKTPEAQAEFREYNADAAVVVAYGMILPQAILDIPKYGCFNLHASLLPHWRGAAPINRAIMEREAKSGVMVMQMDAGLDTGDIARTNQKRTVEITNKMTAGELHDQLALLGANLMRWAMGALESGKLRFKKQKDEKLPYATKIEKAEARIDWNKPRAEVLRHINGLSPFPGAWCEVLIESEAVRLKILRSSLLPGPRRKVLPAPGSLLDEHLTVACGDGAIRIIELQRAGGRPMKAEEFLRGTPLKPPMRLT
jgi:methionyl-tRNA formyltransferase